MSKPDFTQGSHLVVRTFSSDNPQSIGKKYEVRQNNEVTRKIYKDRIELSGTFDDCKEHADLYNQQETK